MLTLLARARAVRITKQVKRDREAYPQPQATGVKADAAICSAVPPKPKRRPKSAVAARHQLG
eukprot:5309365-Pyramimonas_sp.AAC.1